jgi:methylated-DNA-[protein]-cysteine S-methyltransferase
MHPRVWTRIESPIGDLTIVATNDAIVAIEMSPARPATTANAVREDAYPLLIEARRQLDAYFRGELNTFSLPLRPSGTNFQQRVWKALEDVPYGVTASYNDIAKAIGAPGSARAVGAANGANPLPIVVPCHRVIGSDGSLTGYGGGLDRKRKLLSLETGPALRL